MTENTINRKIAPSFGKIESLNIVEATSVKLDNGIQLYYFNSGDQDVVKLEFIFNAGKYHQSKPLQASAASALLDDGTSKMSAENIADRFDFFGAYLNTKSNYDFAETTLHCQTKHLKELLPLIADMFMDSVFPEPEISLFRHNGKARLIQDLERVEVLASQKFNQVLFGTEHPYGHTNTPEFYDALQRKDIIDFYEERYNPGQMKIILAGKFTDETIREINSVMGSKSILKNKKENVPVSKKALTPDPEKIHFIKKNQSVQSAIRVGKPMLHKAHPDFHGMLVVNTLLGGYFGSRLMSNLREDKGFTYGVHSSVSSYLHEGFFSVATEVGTDVTDNAVKEIFNEIKRLKEEPVPDDELELVKNYMLGSFMRGIDGPFMLADRFVSLVNFGLNYEYYHRYIRTVNTITSAKIRELAEQYFSEDSFYTVIAGNK